MPGKKLLVADDSLTIQKVIRLALSNEGYEIQAISDGADCIQQISTFRPDAILIDVSLPTRSAFEIKREVNGLGDHAAVKFILMSSAFEKIDEAQAAEVGFDGHLTKPFDPAHLRQVLSQVLAAPPKSSKKPPPIQAPPPGPPKETSFEIEDDEPKTSVGIRLEVPLDFSKDFSKSGFEISESAKALPEFSPPPPPLPIETTDEEELWGKHEEETPPPVPPSNPVTHSPPPASQSQDDIRQLTESTIRMSGLADMPPLAESMGDSNWKVNEPSMRPPGALSDLGGSSFQMGHSHPAPTPSAPEHPRPEEHEHVQQHGSYNNEEIRRQVHETLQATIEKMARQILPEVAERVIKAEINRLLNEKS